MGGSRPQAAHGSESRDDPYGYCLPLGVPRINFRSEFKIVQTPVLTVFLHEDMYVGMIFRQVFTDDGRAERQRN